MPGSVDLTKASSLPNLSMRSLAVIVPLLACKAVRALDTRGGVVVAIRATVAHKGRVVKL